MSGMTIRDILDIASNQRRNEIFAEFPESGRYLTFGELARHTRSVGHYLRQKGLAKKRNVAILMRNGEEMTKVLLGVMRGGYAAATINPFDSAARISYMIRHSEADIIFVLDEFKRLAEETVCGIEKRPDIIVVDKIPEIIFGADISDYGETGLSCDQPASLLYTSGSTGKPKGVLLSHKNLITNAMYVKEAHLLSEEDRVLSILPFYHINGLVVTLIAPLLTKGRTVIPHKFHARIFWELIEKYKITWVSAVPTILSYLIRNYEHHRSDFDYDCSTLRFVRSASMMLPVEIQRQFEKIFNCMVIESLGLTETAGQVFSNPCSYSMRKYGSVGIPYGNDVKIIDEEGSELGDGAGGEIVVSGDNVMLGYYRDEESTAGSFINGYFKTGDVGYRDKDGYYFITGRNKEIIIRAGENISPLEIDNVLYSHPAVEEAAAVGIPDDLYGQEVKAFVVLKKDSGCSEEGLIEFCREYLPDYKCPKTIEFVSKLPKAPSGKILRLRLMGREMTEDRQTDDVAEGVTG